MVPAWGLCWICCPAALLNSHPAARACKHGPTGTQPPGSRAARPLRCPSAGAVAVPAHTEAGELADEDDQAASLRTSSEVWPRRPPGCASAHGLQSSVALHGAAALDAAGARSPHHGCGLPTLCASDGRTAAFEPASLCSHLMHAYCLQDDDSSTSDDDDNASTTSSSSWEEGLSTSVARNRPDWTGASSTPPAVPPLRFDWVAGTPTPLQVCCPSSRGTCRQAGSSRSCSAAVSWLACRVRVRPARHSERWQRPGWRARAAAVADSPLQVLAEAARQLDGPGASSLPDAAPPQANQVPHRLLACLGTPAVHQAAQRTGQRWCLQGQAAPQPSRRRLVVWLTGPACASGRCRARRCCQPRPRPCLDPGVCWHLRPRTHTQTHMPLGGQAALLRTPAGPSWVVMQAELCRCAQAQASQRPPPTVVKRDLRRIAIEASASALPRTPASTAGVRSPAVHVQETAAARIGPARLASSAGPLHARPAASWRLRLQAHQAPCASPGPRPHAAQAHRQPRPCCCSGLAASVASSAAGWRYQLRPS